VKRDLFFRKKKRRAIAEKGADIITATNLKRTPKRKDRSRSFREAVGILRRYSSYTKECLKEEGPLAEGEWGHLERKTASPDGEPDDSLGGDPPAEKTAALPEGKLTRSQRGGTVNCNGGGGSD